MIEMRRSRGIEPDAFEQDVLHTARKLAVDGHLKIALFKLHELLESGESALEKVPAE
ncbi:MULTISPECIES: hypothetical protein [unclassified Caballeronia]|uniref:hypothetical protein n=1 Tax=unclassified Caballeronia TaxID=2646786 RepID=UPI0028610C2F|nr:MULTISPECIES: hypothetical protein [unclassified Caballeronia]MDR5763149.1 hypothetical protein [Caballeronia sp. LZ035]MDR5883981.1 hypothetical protein [Caballeronia sp. LZ032]